MKSSNSVFWQDYLPCCRCPLLRKDVFLQIYKQLFKRLYPQATDVEWGANGRLPCGRIYCRWSEIDVWFNKQAEWVMTETDVESLEKVPAPVAEAFMSSTMTGMRLWDIRIITFPNIPQ